MRSVVAHCAGISFGIPRIPPGTHDIVPEPVVSPLTQKFLDDLSAHEDWVIAFFMTAADDPEKTQILLQMASILRMQIFYHAQFEKTPETKSILEGLACQRNGFNFMIDTYFDGEIPNKITDELHRCLQRLFSNGIFSDSCMQYRSKVTGSELQTSVRPANNRVD